MNNLTKFILENENWLELLQTDPYNLIIKTDEDYPNVYLFKYNQYNSDNYQKSNQGWRPNRRNIFLAIKFCRRQSRHIGVS